MAVSKHSRGIEPGNKCGWSSERDLNSGSPDYPSGASPLGHSATRPGFFTLRRCRPRILVIQSSATQCSFVSDQRLLSLKSVWPLRRRATKAPQLSVALTQSRTQVNFSCELLQARRLVLDNLTFPRVASHSSGALTMERFQLHENSCEIYKKSGKKEKKTACKACKTVGKFLAFSSPPSSCLFQLHIRHFKHVTFFEPRMATESALFSC